MDTKLACIIEGVIGMIFGSLALVLPEITLGTFIALFWILIIGGVLLSLFLATTSGSQETMFWFGVSCILLFTGVASFFFQAIVAIIFLFIIAGCAFYLAFKDFSLALTQQKMRYYLIIGMIALNVLLLTGIIIYLPDMVKNPKLMVMGILGTFSLVFGIFSLLMGWYLNIDDVAEHGPVPKKG